MSNRVTLPESLAQFQYFIVRYDRDTEHYELLEPQRTNSYDLGTFIKAHAYFVRMKQEYLGERALSSAKNFGAAMAVISTQRAWGLDLCKVDMSTGLLLKSDIDENRRLADDTDDDAVVRIPQHPAKLKQKVKFP